MPLVFLSLALLEPEQYRVCERLDSMVGKTALQSGQIISRDIFFFKRKENLFGKDIFYRLLH